MRKIIQPTTIDRKIIFTPTVSTLSEAYTTPITNINKRPPKKTKYSAKNRSVFLNKLIDLILHYARGTVTCPKLQSPV